MTKYIGLDVHSTSCTMAVVNDAGRKLQHHIVETSEQALIDCLRSIPGPRRLCLEEGTQSTWLYEVLSPHVDELVVAGTSKKQNGPKNDLRDAINIHREAMSRRSRLTAGLGRTARVRHSRDR